MPNWCERWGTKLMSKFIVSYETPSGRPREIEVEAINHQDARHIVVESLKIDYNSIKEVKYS